MAHIQSSTFASGLSNPNLSFLRWRSAWYNSLFWLLSRKIWTAFVNEQGVPLEMMFKLDLASRSYFWFLSFSLCMQKPADVSMSTVHRKKALIYPAIIRPTNGRLITSASKMCFWFGKKNNMHGIERWLPALYIFAPQLCINHIAVCSLQETPNQTIR